MSLPSELTPFAAGKGNTARIFKSGPGTQAFTAHSLHSRGQSVVMIAPGAREYAELKALITLLSRNDFIENNKIVPAWERDWVFLPPYLCKTPVASEWAERWTALHALTRGGKQSVLMTVDNLLPKWPMPSVLENNYINLSKGEEMEPELLMEQLISWGYSRTKLVSEYGEMSMRGDILDVYAPGYDLPVRLEFFGDILEEIRVFEPSSQRSKADLDDITLLPVAPAMLTGNSINDAAKLWEKLKTTGDISSEGHAKLSEKIGNADGMIWPGLFYPECTDLKSFLSKKAVYILSSASNLRLRLQDHEYSWKTFLHDKNAHSGCRWPVNTICWNEEKARSTWRDERQIVYEDLVIGREKNGIDLSERSLTAFTDLFWKPEQIKRPWAALVAGLKEWSSERFQTVLSFKTDRSRKKFLSLIESEQLSISTEYSPLNRGVYALISPLKTGMELEWNQTLILGEDVLQPESAKGTRVRDKAFEGMTSYEDLLPEDLLVHRDYGLSRFGGLHHFKVGDVSNDYLLLFFDGDDKLYVPVDRLNLVQKYKGPEGTCSVLDKLGGSRWSKTREKARKAIEKIAGELVEMYAYRKVAKGYAYGPLNDMYWEFESSFGFEETPDQEKAIQDVFRDMESPEPMDRLVCGDVGFGKTEVALRAAFRAVLDGKQVILLCPTTVLAEQHYQTFLQRMEGFPVTVGMLSRFVTKNSQKRVLEQISSGQLDILIGTHRVLSKDVEAPNLGLLILDEEQRFGVRHKERIKEMRKNIDALTLTATPIPRTLQLSLSGVRSLSTIETPPVDRKPVETALIERDEVLLASVIKREMERGGQVFWVHNRVQGLERVVEFVKKLAPDAKIGMAHGQMSEKNLEDTIHKFWHKELDILIATAIIESGLDFPNANTLIVDQAQMFGLGQLYQLRGRVGRSTRQAYAYFVVSSLDSLSEKAKRRMQIILQLDYLGAGFKVAMEDLRLRGAGNILGEVQSGQMAKVGLDLFLEMLDEEVRRIKGDDSTVATDPEMNFVFKAHLPEDYVPDARERLRYYRALSSANTEARIEELAAEIKDRFGHFPEEVENFITVLYLKRNLAHLGVTRADLFPARVVLTWEDSRNPVDPAKLMEWIADDKHAARLKPPASIEIRFDKDIEIAAGLSKICKDLEPLVEKL
ncbi:transcription-repair coupling factor [Desulfovibrio gilichinskyi]|uniref:Transcription-repair-coupling factor n=1 Tax=Desulfovibrio gilichinskyi TaxID=1519643 RepID=A0A1X7CCR2_9BACT|nr:transcription-repair coupling factor [Desulfovibrio gilichinskyi]SME94120.1 transcription-repair coupling factor (superfamily II helicase) [Desulfovibrio gilichinskyi]